MNPFKKEKKQVGIFITAGYPALTDTGKQIIELQHQGVDFIEIGIPFSDPLADGPVIQATSAKAIANGMQLDLLFSQIEEINDQVKIPLVFMGYLNPILSYGMQKFLTQCKKLSINHVIFPDMSPEIYDRFYQVYFEEAKVHPCFLITPETEPNRIVDLARRCRNSFIYLVSENSTTGNLVNFDSSNLKSYSNIKELCNSTPLFIGFGIKSKKDVQYVHNLSDGAIIGSAYLKALEINQEKEFIDDILN